MLPKKSEFDLFSFAGECLVFVRIFSKVASTLTGHESSFTFNRRFESSIFMKTLKLISVSDKIYVKIISMR